MQRTDTIYPKFAESDLPGIGVEPLDELPPPS